MAAREARVSALIRQEPIIDLVAFRDSLTASAPPAGLVAAVEALWWDAKDDWDKAHAIAQADEAGAGDWVRGIG